MHATILLKIKYLKSKKEEKMRTYTIFIYILHIDSIRTEISERKSVNLLLSLTVPVYGKLSQNKIIKVITSVIPQ